MAWETVDKTHHHLQSSTSWTPLAHEICGLQIKSVVSGIDPSIIGTPGHRIAYLAAQGIRYNNNNKPAGGRGASVSACAGLTNQLLRCWVGPRIAWKKHWHSNCRRPVDGGGGTPRPVLLTGAKNSHLGCLNSFELPMGLLSEFRCH